MKDSDSLKEQDTDPILRMKTGMEDLVDLNDPEMRAMNDEFKRNLYKYTVSMQEDRDDIDRALTEKASRKNALIQV